MAEFVPLASIDTMLCAICLSLWTDPTEIDPCEHIFCRGCVGKVAKCPSCREPIKGLKKPNRILLNLLAATQGKCDSCEWLGSKEQFDAAHANTCAAHPEQALPPPTAPRSSPQPDVGGITLAQARSTRQTIGEMVRAMFASDEVQEATRRLERCLQELALQERLPPGWQRATTPEGSDYYVDHHTQTTHWELPPHLMRQAAPQLRRQVPEWGVEARGAPPSRAARPGLAAPLQVGNEPRSDARFLSQGQQQQRNGQRVTARSPRQAPPTDRPFKTALCTYWEHGTCSKGGSCTYAHGVGELRPSRHHNAL